MFILEVPACFLEEEVSVPSAAASGRRDPTAPLLDEHLATTRKLLKKLGLRRGDVVASLFAEGSDERTARAALAAFEANLVSLPAGATHREYASHFARIQAKLLFLHPGEHPARDAAWEAEIPVAVAFRHFDAGIFSLERDLPPVRKLRAVPLVLIASGVAYSRLAARLDPDHRVIGITPPSLEQLSRPHTIEHIAAECVRMLRRHRPHGPYALSGCRAEALVALEMGRLLEEDGESVAFVAMLDASELFCSTAGRVKRLLTRLWGRKPVPPCDFLAEALSVYRPKRWYGRIIHLAPDADFNRSAWFEWENIASHGMTARLAPSEMLTEPSVNAVATILASELNQSRPA